MGEHTSNYKPEVLIVSRLADNPELLVLFEELVGFVREWADCDTYLDGETHSSTCERCALLKKIEGE